VPPPPPNGYSPPTSHLTAPPVPTASSTPAGPVSPDSSISDPPTGPFGTPFSSGSFDACTGSPAGQPPDVASDVSASQAVELLNSGIWVFNKQGQVQGSPESPASFWFTDSPQAHMTDTQIAFDPFTQTWVATMLSLPANDSTGDLLFAFSQTSDATKGWTFSAVRNVCASVNASFPTPDMPIVGYNQTWVAVALRCLSSGGIPPAGTDQLILINPSNLAVKQESAPFFNARPSRDISGAGGENLFMVAPEVPTTTLPYVAVTTVDSNGNFVGPGPGGTTLNSPTNGVLGTANITALAPHDNCGPGSTCEVSLQDDRITSVVLQKGNDGNHYLLTSFQAGDQVNSTAQSLYFVGQVESFASGASGMGGT
jgi:hypothetical protein